MAASPMLQTCSWLCIGAACAGALVGGLLVLVVIRFRPLSGATLIASAARRGAGGRAIVETC